MLAVHCIGHVHTEQHKQGQDISSAFKTQDGKTVSLICDGCSSMPYPEVGATLFCVLFRKKFTHSSMDVDKVARETLIDVMRTMSNNQESNYDDVIFKFLGFTILISLELDNEFKVYSAGDGVIVSITHDNIIEYSILEDEVPNVPQYLAYDYVKDKSKMSSYKNGAKFTINTFDKSEFKQIGVASDGLTYILTSVKTALRIAFEKLLLNDSLTDLNKYNKIKELIYSNHSDFGDDFSFAIN